MTQIQLVGLLLIGPVLLYLNRKKNRQNRVPPPQMVYFETIEIEMIDLRRSRKVPEFVVNLAIVAVILGFIWLMNGA